MRTILILMGLLMVAILFSLTGGISSQAQPAPTPTPTPSMSGMDMDGMDTGFAADDFVPLVRGIYEGEDIFFIHTETSDPDISALLTEMMGPDVITVPSLAEIPEELLGDVFVFTNGIEGSGPLGFQPDIFSSVPPDPNYTPLRNLNLVTWQEDGTPRRLESVSEIAVAEEAGEINIERPGIVINMPILIWPDGQR